MKILLNTYNHKNSFAVRSMNKMCLLRSLRDMIELDATNAINTLLSHKDFYIVQHAVKIIVLIVVITEAKDPIKKYKRLKYFWEE